MSADLKHGSEGYPCGQCCCSKGEWSTGGCELCEGKGGFADAKVMVTRVISYAKDNRLPVIAALSSFAFRSIATKGHEPGELFKLSQELNVPRNLMRYGWDSWEIYARHEGVAPELADLGRSVMREWYNHSWEQFEDEVGFEAAEYMIAQAKAEPDKTEARWAYLLSEEWMVA